MKPRKHKLSMRDEGVPGLVLRLSAPVFVDITVQGNTVNVGGGTALSGLLSEAAKNSLAGLETLIGIPGTVGGALRSQSGSHAGAISQWCAALKC